MSKLRKTVSITILIMFALIIGFCFLFAAWWNGFLNFMLPREISAYNSPDGEYALVFEQMGDPEWPFGATDIRLTLKNEKGKVIKRISTQLHDDGANAGEHNVASVQWDDEGVSVVLRASEMEDKEVVIGYSD